MGLDSSTPSVGQTNNANSIPVVISTDQTTVPTSVLGTTFTVGNELNVYDANASLYLSLIAGSLGATSSGVFYNSEFPVTTKTDADVSGVSYTVPSGKKFLLTGFFGSYDAQSSVYFRFKKQTGGVGAWTTLFRITLEVGGQGQSTYHYNFGNGLFIGSATDKFKITVEATLVKGSAYTGFTGTVL